jgi:hypothetical protein
LASIADEHAAFYQLADQLRSTAKVSARAIRACRGVPVSAALDGQIEHTLDRLALLYGCGTYENVSTVEIFEAALNNEVRLATVLDEPDGAAAARRARALVDAARRGVRLHVREPAPPEAAYRAVYIEPFGPELERSLLSREEPYLRWRDGVVLVLDEEEASALRTGGAEVDVLFLDSGEFLELEARGDWPAFEAELERRLIVARADPGRIGDSGDRYLLRLLDDQSIVLRNLRDRLSADSHPSAHAALLPILTDHRAPFEARLAIAGTPAEDPLAEDPLAALIHAERDVLSLAARWSAEPGDPAGLRKRFRAVAGAGTRLAELERHRVQEGTT